MSPFAQVNMPTAVSVLHNRLIYKAITARRHCTSCWQNRSAVELRMKTVGEEGMLQEHEHTPCY